MGETSKLKWAFLSKVTLPLGPACQSCFTQNLVFFVDYSDFYWLILLNCSQRHPAKIQTLSAQVEVFIEREEKQQQTLQSVPPPLNSRRKKKYWNVECSPLLFQYSSYHASATLPQVYGVAQCRIKGKRTYYFFPPTIFQRHIVSSTKGGESTAFKNLLSPEGNLPVDDIEVKEKCTATFANHIWANWTPKVRIWLGARTRTAVTLFLVQRRIQLAGLHHSFFSSFPFLFCSLLFFFLHVNSDRGTRNASIDVCQFPRSVSILCKSMFHPPSKSSSAR